MASIRGLLRSRHAAALAAAGVLAFAQVLSTSSPAAAGEPWPKGTWRLDGGSSILNFQSVKKGTVLEISKFAGFEGEVGEDGSAKVTISLESVDTGVDLRNVRMRFLFFETYKFPTATVSAKIDPAAFRDLLQKRRLRHDLAYKLSLHGVTKEFVSPVNVTLIDDDTVSIASMQPIPIEVAGFGLEAGLKKLEEAVGGIVIVPATSVTFDMIFRGQGGGVVSAMAATNALAALESQGVLTSEECRTRFDVLSRTEAVYFRTASAALDAASEPLLDTVFGIAERCPDLAIEIAGHTDSDGASQANQRLSERRARAVVDFLVAKGIASDRLSGVGYGEDKPVAANDIPANKSKNRRIEFQVRGN